MSPKLKNILKELVKEMSATGTGAGVVPGEGEGVAGYSWVGGRKKKVNEGPQKTWADGLKQGYLDGYNDAKVGKSNKFLNK